MHIRTLALLVAILIAASFGRTQDDPARPELNSLEQSGKLLTVKLVPASKNLNIYVVGKPAMKLDLSKAKIEVTTPDTPSRVFTVRNAKDYFVAEKLDLASTKEIHVKTKVNNQEEIFKFKVENKPH